MVSDVPAQVLLEEWTWFETERTVRIQVGLPGLGVDSVSGTSRGLDQGVGAGRALGNGA